MITLVLVVDNHPLSSEGLLNSLSEIDKEVEILNIFSNGPKARFRAASPAPDVILVSYETAAEFVAAITAAVRARGLAARVVVFNAPDDLSIARGLLAAGVSGYVVKSAPNEQVQEAIYAADEGEVWLSPTLGAQAVKQWMAEEDDLPELNEWEQAVLALLAQGLGNKEMAAQLSLAESTVNNTVSCFYKLFGTTR